MQGKFITLEGPEGSGKSTHSRLLAERLRQCGLTVVQTREPGGTRLGEAIRQLLQYNGCGEAPQPAAEVLLFCASRAQLTAQVIIPALQRGEWVICDRFTDSTLAYQGYGRGYSLSALRQLNDFTTGGLQPNLTLLFDVDTKTSLHRVRSRKTKLPAGAKDRFESEPSEFHRKIRDGFIALAAAEPERFKVLDTKKPLAQTQEMVWQIVAPLVDNTRGAVGECNAR
ncbi:MAG: dTMP kinase [Lentisphaerae bacterium]|nr:dTMP kinase [Lentisphaerota bacterium]